MTDRLAIVWAHLCRTWARTQRARWTAGAIVASVAAVAFIVLTIDTALGRAAHGYSHRRWCAVNAATLPYAGPILEELGVPFDRISCCESNGRADARNGRHLGLFQIGPSWHRWARLNSLDLLSVDGNIAAAAHIADVQGLSAWSSSRGCWR